MKNVIKFTSAFTNAKPSTTLIMPDENGYYEHTVGALNTSNTSGAHYDLESAKALFESSSTLMRRIKKGYLKAELGHPKKLPGMSDKDYIRRICTIEETNVCAHFKEVWLTEADAKGVVLIKALIKPTGPHAETLEASFKNPDENVAFSIRSITDDIIKGGRHTKYIRSILGWDYVNEPGLSMANSWSDLGVSLETIDSTLVSIDAANEVYEELKLAGNENDSLLLLDIIKTTEASLDTPKKTFFSTW